ncbi:MAG: tetratricopeptide repeat protein [Anaeromyxobacteraceae bacterium]
MIAFLLSLSLAAAAPAKGAPPPKKDAAAAQPAPKPAEEAPAEETALQPLDADTMAFLSSGGATNSRDGSVRLDWPGPGGNQLKLSWDSLDKRNEEVQTAEMLRISLVGAVQSFYDGDGTIDVAGMRAKLKALLVGPVDEARTSYMSAIKLEERRLFFVERGVAEAAAAKEELPGVDGRLISKRLTAIRDGRIAMEVQNRVNGYRSLAVGLLAYLDGDTFGALNNVREASGGLKDVAVVHALLGSLYALYGQTDAAVVAWKKSLELDPTNKAVREAILQHSPKTRQVR